MLLVSLLILEAKHADFDQAFTQADLDDEIFMRLPARWTINAWICYNPHGCTHSLGKQAPNGNCAKYNRGRIHRPQYMRSRTHPPQSYLTGINKIRSCDQGGQLLSQ